MISMLNNWSQSKRRSRSDRLHEAFESVHTVGDVLVVGGIAEADEAFAAFAEADAGDNEHVLLIQQVE